MSCFTASARVRAPLRVPGRASGLVAVRLPARQRVGEKHSGALRSVLRQWRAQILHGKADLQMRDHERRGHDLEPEHPLGCRPPDFRARERPKALLTEILGDTAEHFRQIGPRSAARVQHIDVLRREPRRAPEIVLERSVHSGHHVADHLGRRVPHAQLLS